MTPALRYHSCLGDHNILVLDGCFCVARLGMSEFSDRRCQARQMMYFRLTRPLFCLVYWILCIVGQCVLSFALCNAFVYIFVVDFIFLSLVCLE
uniref:Putative zinc finger protein 2 n=1 Tax=Ixodes ricinus TaxID=34613 RepID=A0A0K8RJS0_IXORI